MLRDGWNFHGDIAINLEGIAKSYFGDTGRPVSKIYDADVIEQISFAECMIILVRAKTGYSNDMENADSFVKKAGKYIGMSGNSIEDAYGTIRYLC